MLSMENASENVLYALSPPVLLQEVDDAAVVDLVPCYVCVYMYVCMYVCMQCFLDLVLSYMCVCVCMYVCMYVCSAFSTRTPAGSR